MQGQAVSGASEQSAAKESLSAQGSRLAIGGGADGALEFCEQVEQQQDAAESGFGGENSCRQKSAAPKSYFSSGIRFSTPALRL